MEENRRVYETDNQINNPYGEWKKTKSSKSRKTYGIEKCFMSVFGKLFVFTSWYATERDRKKALKSYLKKTDSFSSFKMKYVRR